MHYQLQYRDKYTSSGKSDWIYWRDQEMAADTKKSVLRADLENIKRIFPNTDFRYVKSIQIIYSKEIIVD